MSPWWGRFQICPCAGAHLLLGQSCMLHSRLCACRLHEVAYQGGDAVPEGLLHGLSSEHIPGYAHAGLQYVIRNLNFSLQIYHYLCFHVGMNQYHWDVSIKKASSTNDITITWFWRVDTLYKRPVGLNGSTGGYQNDQLRCFLLVGVMTTLGFQSVWCIVSKICYACLRPSTWQLTLISIWQDRQWKQCDFVDNAEIKFFSYAYYNFIVILYFCFEKYFTFRLCMIYIIFRFYTHTAVS